MGILNDIVGNQSFLQAISLGLLSSDNWKEGMAKGGQILPQLNRQRQLDDQNQQRLDLQADLMDLRKQNLQGEIDDRERMRTQEGRFNNYLSGQSGAMAANGGPTMAAAQAMDAGTNLPFGLSPEQAKFASMLPGMDAKMSYVQEQMKPKEPVGSQTWYSPDGKTKQIKKGSRTEEWAIANGWVTAKPNVPGEDGTPPNYLHSGERIGDIVIQQLKGGGVRATELNGAVIPEDQVRERYARAQEMEVQNQQARAQGRGLGSTLGQGQGDIAIAAFDKLGQIQSNIGALDQVVQEIDAGANTGAIQRYLPNVQAASVRLDQLRKELGLSVVQMVQFGALSDSELQVAMDTALPTGLNGPQLREWAVSKANAQRKAYNALLNVAQHFGKGGTLASFVGEQYSPMEMVTTSPAQTTPGKIPQHILDDIMILPEDMQQEYMNRAKRKFGVVDDAKGAVQQKPSLGGS